MQGKKSPEGQFTHHITPQEKVPEEDSPPYHSVQEKKLLGGVKNSHITLCRKKSRSGQSTPVLLCTGRGGSSRLYYSMWGKKSSRQGGWCCKVLRYYSTQRQEKCWGATHSPSYSVQKKCSGGNALPVLLCAAEKSAWGQLTLGIHAWLRERRGVWGGGHKMPLCV